MSEKKKVEKIKNQIEYTEFPLNTIIHFFIKEALKKKDWTICAIDSVNNTVILKRYNL